MIWKWDTVECNGRTFLVTVKEITPIMKSNKKIAEVFEKLYAQKISVCVPLNGPKKT